MKRAILLLFVVVCCAHAQYSGMGASTIQCLDKDGDTYGPGCAAGVDADDKDPSVNTTATALAKYTTAAASYAHLGTITGDTNYYSGSGGTGIQRYWVLAPSGGNDGTCTSHTFLASPDPTAVTACATLNHVAAAVVAGDMVIFRGGTYTPGIAQQWVTSGTAANPITLIAYPGEDPYINWGNTGGLSLDAMSYIAIDGLRMANASNAGISGGSAYGGPPYLTVGASRFAGNRFRNLNISSSVRGMLIMDGISDLIIEDSIIGDEVAGGTHNIYLGGRSNPSDAVTVQRNILHGSGDQVGTGIQFNGRVTNLLVENNFIWGNGLACISLEQGVSNSIIRNNACWNNKRGGLVLFDYFPGGVDGDATCYNASGHVDQAGTYGICAWPQTGNLWENNTVYMAQYDPIGGEILQQPCVQMSDTTPNGPHDFSGNVFRNNICQNYNGWFLTTSGTITATTLNLTLENNIFYPTTSYVGSQWARDISSGGGGDDRYTLAQLTTLYGAGQVRGNSSANPLFTALGTWDHPENTDLRLQPTAPGVNTGSTTNAPADDVLGHARTVTPSIGAYQYASGGTAIPLNTWVNVLTHGQPIQAVGWEKLRYARAAKRLVYQGDYHINNNEPNNAFLMFDPETIRWDVMAMTGLFHDEMMPEAGHQDGLFDWDSTRNVFTALCCMTFGRQPENPYFTWWYDPVGQAGRNKHTSPSHYPGSGNQNVMTYDAAHDVFVLFSSGDGHTWEYSPSTNAWTEYTPSPAPIAGLQLSAIAYNSDDGHAYLFGGQWGGATFYNKVWKYDQPTHSWTDLTISGTKPAGRYEHGWDYDSTNHVFVMYGGFIDNATTLSQETWAFDSVRLAWTQLATFTGNGDTVAVPPFERFGYDKDHNLFVLVARTNTSAGAFASDAQWARSSFVAQTWLLRVGGVGPSVGALTASPAVSSGSINRNSTAWAQAPAITSDGTDIYAAWEETGINSDSTEGSWVHTYASKYAGTWSTLGATYAALNPETPAECAGFTVDGHAPSMAVISSVPWISYYAGCEQATSIYVKSWGGSSWSGGTVGKVNPFGILATKVMQGRNTITAVGSTPYVAFIETQGLIGDGNQEQLLFVKSNSGSWSLVGGYLNRDRIAGTTTSCTPGTGACSRASSVAITNDGSAPIVAFTEYLTNDNGTDTNPKLYVSRWNGAAWVALGGAINTTGAWAQDAAITYIGGEPYVAWVERTQAGSAQVFVKRYTGGSWQLVGAGTRNKDTSTGWAYRPSLATDGTNLYLGWVEQQAIGQRAKSHVDKWNGSAWSSIGTAINADSTVGSAQGISLIIAGSQPVAAWSEANFGAQRQVYTRAYNGATWNALGGGAPPPSGLSRFTGSFTIR